MGGEAFVPVRRRRIETLNVEYREYRHRATGAVHIHLAAADRNNCFVAAFPTVPRDSTGVAHILEHTVLCGSRRYPVRDPFFMMLRRSLNTFMNAFTTSDATAYPFATQNRKDFDNLLSVYLDAVFFPRLDPLDFAQEGHRLEFATPSDPTSPLVCRGVVYNEMKGAMSAPIAQLQQQLQSLLFPTTTYHHNSGGDPERIPDLTYGQLKAFHASHYHPSNATFMTYGDIEVDRLQGRMEELALDQFTAQPFDLGLRDEVRYREPMRVESWYTDDGSAGDRDRTYIAFGWLLGHVGNSRELMRDMLLGNVLLQHSASPLRQALETTDLGSAPLDFSGLDDSAREAMFICGLEGCDPGSADAVEELVLDVLEGVARDGVPAAEIEAVLTQLEIAQREINSGHFPYGLQLLSRVLGARVHGGDPLDYLDIDPAIGELRREIADPEFIKGLARRLIDNPHRVRLVLRPDPGLAARRDENEQRRLAAIGEGLDAGKRREIVELAGQLDARQRRSDDPDCLPRVELVDVPGDLVIPAGSAGTVGELPITWYQAGTNGLLHAQVIAELPPLSADEAEMLTLYYSALTEVGSAGRDYLETQAEQSRTGPVSAYVSVRAGVTDAGTVRGYLALAGKSLNRDRERLSRLLRATVESARFDELARLRDLVAQMRAALESSAVDRGHTLAILAASSGMGPSGYLDNLFDGPVAIGRVKTLDAAIEADIDRLRACADLLRAINDKVIARPKSLLMVCQDGERAQVEDALRSTWSGAVVGNPGAGFVWPAADRRVHEAWVTNTQVNFCARAYKAVPADHGDAPVFSVLGKFLHHGYLHRAIREQGGAYGAGASYDSDSASFRFFSYRDPRLDGTLEDFDRALDWVQGAHGARAVEEAILGVIQLIDQPKSPAGEAIQAHFHALQGRTPEFRRRFRNRVLGVTVADLQRVARTYLDPAVASTAVITSREVAERHRHLGFEINTF
jgi:Zn-dependent M16 (insulinase) family peptidase